MDDHSLFLKGFSMIIEKLESRYSFEILLQANQIENPENDLPPLEILFLDLNLDRYDGLETLTKLRDIAPKMKIIIMSMYNDDRMVKEAMKRGADGYLSKNTSLQELDKAITEVMMGKVYLGNDIKSAMVNQTTTKIKSGQPITRFNAKIHLTKREMEILEFIFQGLSNKDIAAALFISKDTVGVHRKNLMRKLGANSATGLLKKATELNLI